MPKKIIPDEEYEEEEDDDEEDDEDAEDAEEEVAPRGRPRKSLKKSEPQSVNKRYSAFQQQAAEGIVDSETQEIIASDIWTALANIIERLERIETAIGVM